MSTHKASTNEEEYFAREEAEKKRRLAQEHAKSLAVSEREHLRALHAMHCPKCGLRLAELSYHGIKVERCFSCHGIFLDESDVAHLAKEGMWSRVLHFFAQRDYTPIHDPPTVDSTIK